MRRELAIQIAGRFDPGEDGLARKSKDLTMQLLAHGEKPFSRDRFAPGHITCTALIFHPEHPGVLMMHHHKLHRWLLPGGHVDDYDPSLVGTAAREAFEETGVVIDPGVEPFLAGIDVHGIPPKRNEPYHLHHDLIWCFGAADGRIEETPEAPRVMWASEADWDSLILAESIRNSIRRAVEYRR